MASCIVQFCSSQYNGRLMYHDDDDGDECSVDGGGGDVDGG